MVSLPRDLAARPLDLSRADLAWAECQCGGATPFCDPQKRCVSCLLDTHCPMGQTCRKVGSTTGCVPGCDDDSRCGGSFNRCCGGTCVDIERDPVNCGRCNYRCQSDHASATCNNGGCAIGACNPNWGNCNGIGQDGCETNLQSDVDHCGACNAACNLANATAACANVCYVMACHAGFEDCNGDSPDGCETDLRVDNRNCGRCGAACAMGKTCVNASCV